MLWLMGNIEGRRIRESAGTDNPALAEIKRAAREVDLFKAAVAGVVPTVPFAAAAASYLKAEQPGATQAAAVAQLVRVLGTRPTRSIGQADADRARDVLLGADVKPATVVRHVVAPLTAILRHASRRQLCDWPRLEWPTVARAPFAFLTPAQAEALVAAAAPHAAALIAFLISTGLRMGEATALDWRDIDMAAGRFILWEGTTKTGARRVVQMQPRALAVLRALPGRDGAVFRDAAGAALSGASPIRAEWNAACRAAGLPGEIRRRPNGKPYWQPEHSPHDCRHTYATWHYAMHKDLLLLMRDVGWTKTDMAARYAHVMPEGQEAGAAAFLVGHDHGALAGAAAVDSARLELAGRDGAGLQPAETLEQPVVGMNGGHEQAARPRHRVQRRHRIVVQIDRRDGAVSGIDLDAIPLAGGTGQVPRTPAYH
jgi:integrase